MNWNRLNREPHEVNTNGMKPNLTEPWPYCFSGSCIASSGCFSAHQCMLRDLGGQALNFQQHAPTIRAYISCKFRGLAPHIQGASKFGDMSRKVGTLPIPGVHI
jgi:hypothetical protein